MRKAIVLVLVLTLCTVLVSAQDDLLENSEEIYADIGDVELKESAGLTPQDTLYFLDDFFERLLIGNDAQKALNYKEEKIAEAKEMIELGLEEEAKIALQKAGIYGEIVKKEVSPQVERRARESSKAVKEIFKELDKTIEEQDWQEIKELVEEQEQIEDSIALSAKVSTTIKELCEQLSKIDPLEYEKTCKTDNDAPQWQKELDNELTKEQQKEAEEFFTIMSQCFRTSGEKCACEEISVPAFAKKCSVMAPLAAACDLEDDEEACEKLDKLEREEPIEDLLPKHLQDVLKSIGGDEYDDERYELHMPKECVEAGATTKEECNEVFFRRDAPEECKKALDEGRINLKDEHQAHKECEKVLYEHHAPPECLEEGIDNHEECGIFLFKNQAPQECLDAGIDGNDEDAWEKCDLIKFELEAPQECLDAGISADQERYWEQCDALLFELQAPEHCIDAGIDSKDPRAWEKCHQMEAELNMPEECLDAGLSGKDEDEWKECDLILFKESAPKECLEKNARDWVECDEILREMHEQEIEQLKEEEKNQEEFLHEESVEDPYKEEHKDEFVHQEPKEEEKKEDEQSFDELKDDEDNSEEEKEGSPPVPSAVRLFDEQMNIVEIFRAIFS